MFSLFFSTTRAANSQLAPVDVWFGLVAHWTILLVDYTTPDTELQQSAVTSQSSHVATSRLAGLPGLHGSYIHNFVSVIQLQPSFSELNTSASPSPSTSTSATAPSPSLVSAAISGRM